MKANQKQRILDYIRQFGSITSKDAYVDLGITQLGARIDELERDGYSFVKEREKGKNRFNEEVTYKRYYLANARGN
jgi:hypothetical protein